MIDKNQLRSAIDDSNRASARYFAIVIQSLIVLSLITFSVDTLPNLSPLSRLILDWIETVTVLIFTAEYLLRLWLAESRRDYVFSFFGIVDLLAILPFYLASGLDLRAIRVFRLLRLLRILKLFKYNSALNRLQRALVMVREELIIFGFIAAIMLFLSAVGIYYFENEEQPEQFASVFHSLWWALTTLTTVGYGDMYPVTTGGRVFTFFVLMIGLGVVAVPTGVIASALAQVRTEDRDRGTDSAPTG
jgi:voltage-gated potassium channel